jgi:hypothetical protein
MIIGICGMQFWAILVRTGVITSERSQENLEGSPSSNLTVTATDMVRSEARGGGPRAAEQGGERELNIHLQPD